MTQTTPEVVGSRAAHWSWHHYYFVLAIVDVLVIAASVRLIHQTMGSYEVALHKLATTHAKQRWIANLRLLVMQLNAPGNDVFETQRIAEERSRFEQRLEGVTAEVRRQFDVDLDLDLTEFQEHLHRMTDCEKRIFQLLDAPSDATAPETARRLQEASRMMAAMDRHQTASVTALTELEQTLLMRVKSLIHEHGTRIRGHATIEKIFLGLIGLILIGMFWYGRKLQRLHGQMLADHHRAITERMHRLAAVGEVCAAVAHGIRNPLATISSSAQLGLITASSDDAARLRLQDILSECGRLDRRVTHLLNFASQASHPREQFPLHEVVEQAVAELRTRLEDRRIRVELAFAIRPTIEGDRERMIQCLIELLSNSLEYSPETGVIAVHCVHCHEREGYVDLIVSDNGPGIPPLIAERVFDLFFTTRPGGTGIGLASVKNTVHSHGGEVMIVPAEGRGTQVRLTLPCINPASAR